VLVGVLAGGDAVEFTEVRSALSRPKSGDPLPVAGSQPDVALNPHFVVQPVLEPVVMSFSADAANEYRKGFL
jgi:hypothetical protein